MTSDQKGNSKSKSEYWHPITTECIHLPYDNERRALLPHCFDIQRLENNNIGA